MKSLLAVLSLLFVANVAQAGGSIPADTSMSIHTTERSSIQGDQPWTITDTAWYKREPDRNTPPSYATASAPAGDHKTHCAQGLATTTLSQ
jgi:hypothetical protein